MVRNDRYVCLDSASREKGFLSGEEVYYTLQNIPTAELLRLY